MRREFRKSLRSDDSRADASAYFTLPFDTRDVWGKAKVPVKVTINGYTWRSRVGNRGGPQYIVVNAEARRKAGAKAGDLVTITLEPDTEKREIEIPMALQRGTWQEAHPETRCPVIHSQERIHRLVFGSQDGRHTCSSGREDEADALDR
jgi:hypothetical protein